MSERASAHCRPLSSVRRRRGPTSAVRHRRRRRRGGSRAQTPEPPLATPHGPWKRARAAAGDARRRYGRTAKQTLSQASGMRWGKGGANTYAPKHCHVMYLAIFGCTWPAPGQEAAFRLYLRVVYLDAYFGALSSTARCLRRQPHSSPVALQVRVIALGCVSRKGPKERTGERSRNRTKKEEKVRRKSTIVQCVISNLVCPLLFHHDRRVLVTFCHASHARDPEQTSCPPPSSLD